MTLTKLLRPNSTSSGRGRVRTWSSSSSQGTPPARGRHAPAAPRIVARVLLWALLGTLVVRGAIPARSPRPRPLPSPAREAPQQVEAFAVAFATEYLTIDGNSAERAHRLAPFAPPELAPNLDVATQARGIQRVGFATAAGVSGTRGAYSVTVAARLAAPRPGQERWIWLDVPVADRGGSLAVMDLPSIVPGPERLELPAPDVSGGDPVLEARVQPVLARFFSLYLGAGDPAELSYLTLPGTVLRQPGPFASRVSLTDVTAQQAGGGIDAVVRLLATDPAGLAWPLAYRVRLTSDSGRLEVASVSAASPSITLRR